MTCVKCAWGCPTGRRPYAIRIDAAVTVRATLCKRHLTLLLRRKAARRWRLWGWLIWQASDRVTG